jgi:hypothetical protein
LITTISLPPLIGAQPFRPRRSDAYPVWMELLRTTLMRTDFSDLRTEVAIY